ncbi:MAG: AAA family ATPase, partial [Actinomycetota bacterium]|nr:AAA family ATPase [Actinomycetota bacterium]
MLTDLIVENLGVIETALLTLEKGCTVVTGETGAGKTLIVTALELLGGGRADPSAIRAGSREARIEGRFVLGTDHPVVKILEDNGIVDGQEITSRTDLELVITRTISSTAGRARINGRLVTIGLLGDVGGALLDVVGQHSHQRLFAPAFQRAALDGFAGPEAVTRAQEVADAVRRVQRAVRTLDELQVMQQAQARELDVLRYEIAEIEGAHLEQGERERLLHSATRLEHAEAIAASAAEAMQALSGEGGAEERLLQAASALERGSAQDPGLRSLSERAASIVTEVSDIGFELRANEVEPDPAALEDTRRRLEVIARLCRKFGRDVGEVLGYLDRSRARADELTALPERVSEAKEELEGMIERASALATRLSELRKSAAPRLQQAVETVLAELALGGSKVEVRLDECELYEGGAETVQL